MPCAVFLKSIEFHHTVFVFKEKLRTKCEEQRQRRLSYMAEANERHCAAAPLYGKDLHNALSICNSKMSCPAFITEEYLSCTDCDLLRSLVKAPKTRLYERRELTKRYEIIADDLSHFSPVLYSI